MQLNSQWQLGDQYYLQQRQRQQWQKHIKPMISHRCCMFVTMLEPVTAVLTFEEL
jgi:hypothetical protein